MENDRLSVWVLNSKGGVGKTTLSVAVVDLMEISGRIPYLLEIDTRKRLSSFMGEGVVRSFNGGPPISEIRKNPNLVLGHYDPIVESMENGDTLLDLGANEDPAFLEYARLSRLDEDLVSMGIRVVVLVPTVAENESVRGAIEGLASIQRAVPSAKRVLVLNERDGDNFDNYISKSERSSLLSDDIQIVAMPRIISEGWEAFQRERCRFVEIIGMEVDNIQHKFGFSRPMAKRARGDIAAWFEGVRRGMMGVLPGVGD